MPYLALCNPGTQEQFPTFRHNTTQYVGVPHGCATQLWVGTDKPVVLTLKAENQTVIEKVITPPGQPLLLSTLNQPVVARGGFIPSFLRRKPQGPVQLSQPLRLFDFSATISDGSLRQGGRVLASVEYHVLCPSDYEWADKIHLDVLRDPTLISPWTIADKAEGDRCPLCNVVRERLKSDWQDQG